MTDVSPTRAQRRHRTHAAILQAARQVFAENGYQKATIRLVAERAGFDPALVMQHFGNKKELFRAATAITFDVKQAFDGPGDTRNERVIRYIFEHMDAHTDSVTSTLRSMLTHDQSADEALQLFNPPAPGDQHFEGEADPLAALREQLFMAITLGTAITRYVLKSSVVASATVEELLLCLLPAAEALNPSSARARSAG